jgi:hypothetical protein
MPSLPTVVYGGDGIDQQQEAGDVVVVAVGPHHATGVPWPYVIR